MGWTYRENGQQRDPLKGSDRGATWETLDGWTLS